MQIGKEELTLGEPWHWLEGCDSIAEAWQTRVALKATILLHLARTRKICRRASSQNRTWKRNELKPWQRVAYTKSSVWPADRTIKSAAAWGGGRSTPVARTRQADTNRIHSNTWSARILMHKWESMKNIRLREKKCELLPDGWCATLRTRPFIKDCKLIVPKIKRDDLDGFFSSNNYGNQTLFVASEVNEESQGASTALSNYLGVFCQNRYECFVRSKQIHNRHKEAMTSWHEQTDDETVKLETLGILWKSLC